MADTTTNEAPVIKPCPFCGTVPVMQFKHGDYGYTPDSVILRCQKCGVGWSLSAEKWVQGVGHINIRAESEAHLITKWNTRCENS